MNPTTPDNLPRAARVEMAHKCIHNEAERIRTAMARLQAEPAEYEMLAWQIECSAAQIRKWREHIRELENL
jgi:hypothetical protein